MTFPDELVFRGTVRDTIDFFSANPRVSPQEEQNKIVLVITQELNENINFYVASDNLESIHKLEKIFPKENTICGVHPSPLSAHRGFFGSKPFSKANQRLIELGLTPIDWKI